MYFRDRLQLISYLTCTCIIDIADEMKIGCVCKCNVKFYEKVVLDVLLEWEE